MIDGFSVLNRFDIAVKQCEHSTGWFRVLNFILLAICLELITDPIMEEQLH